MWSPPRGEPSTGGGWQSLWADTGQRLTAAETAAVATYRALIGVLSDQRYTQGWSLRAVAAHTGLPLSTVHALEAGSHWPTFENLAALTDAFDHRLTLTWTAPPTLRRPVRPRPPRPSGRPGQRQLAPASNEPGYGTTRSAPNTSGQCAPKPVAAPRSPTPR